MSSALCGRAASRSVRLGCSYCGRCAGESRGSDADRSGSRIHPEDFGAVFQLVQPPAPPARSRSTSARGRLHDISALAGGNQGEPLGTGGHAAGDEILLVPLFLRRHAAFRTMVRHKNSTVALYADLMSRLWKTRVLGSSAV